MVVDTRQADMVRGILREEAKSNIGFALKEGVCKGMRPPTLKTSCMLRNYH